MMAPTELPRSGGVPQSINAAVGENWLDIPAQVDWLAHMKLDFFNWPDGDQTREFAATANELHLASDTCIFPGPVAVWATVQKAEEQVVVAGQARTVARATCVRCLEEFDIPVDEAFRAVVRIVPPAEVAADTGDDDFFLIPATEPVWDLGEVVRQLILLAVPDNPLCREDCQGLCPGCGRNLNLESCVCTDRKSGGALAQLGDLIQQAQQRPPKRGRRSTGT